MEAEFVVGFDGVESVVLESVGFEFVDESDAASLLSHVYESADAFFGDLGHGGVELFAAVAALAAEDVAGEAFGVDSDEHGCIGVDFAHGQCEVFGGVYVALVGDATEIAPTGGKSGFGDALDE